DGGMFHDANVKLPRFVGTKTPEEVAAGVLRAIERDRAEVDVAPLGLRAGAAAPRRREGRRGNGARPGRQARLSQVQAATRSSSRVTPASPARISSAS